MSYDIKALRDLEKRLASANGPDSYIDCVLYTELGSATRGDPGYPNGPTASIDAAEALVERVLPGWFWRVGHGSLHAGWAHLNRVHPDHCDRKDEASANASTPALALCLACVRALIAQEEARQ